MWTRALAALDDEGPDGGASRLALDEPPRLTLAFDFDNTVIACNSDTAIPRSCDGGAHAAAFDAGLKAFEGSWTTFMDDSLAAMAANGATVDQISRAAREIRIDPAFAETLREIKALPNTTLVIISDANVGSVLK